MAGRPYVLAETNWKTVREIEYEVAILPWGATEAHNLHLPYGTDTMEGEAVAVESARIAWEKGAKCLVLPSVPFGANAQQVDIPHTVNLNPTTQAFVLSDVVESLEAQGLPKLLILNSHGGNEFRPMIRELQAKSDVFLCTLNWFAQPEVAEHFPEPGDHAGRLETSLMLHLAPNQVLPLSEAGAETPGLGTLREARPRLERRSSRPWPSASEPFWWSSPKLTWRISMSEPMSVQCRGSMPIPQSRI